MGNTRDTRLNYFFIFLLGWRILSLFNIHPPWSLILTISKNFKIAILSYGPRTYYETLFLYHPIQCKYKKQLICYENWNKSASYIANCFNLKCWAQLSFFWFRWVVTFDHWRQQGSDPKEVFLISNDIDIWWPKIFFSIICAIGDNIKVT